MAWTDEDKVAGRLHGEQPEPETPDGIVARILYTILIALMMSVVQTILGVLILVQLVIMLVNKRQPNPRLAEFGTILGIWVAKAARYQMAASEVKPWPWTEID